MPGILEELRMGLPVNLRQCYSGSMEHVRYMRQQAEEIEAEIKCWH